MTAAPGKEGTLDIARARERRWIAAQGPAQPWTVHSLMFYVPRHLRQETFAALEAFLPGAMAFGRRRTDRETGEVVFLGRFARADFADPDTRALLPLSEVAAQLRPFPWGECLDLRVHRVDMAADHLVAIPPREVCDRIADLHLPYSRTYRGPEDQVEAWPGVYHKGGKVKAWTVEVVHYPRLESLLHGHQDTPPFAVEYVRQRVRQEVRFRGPGLRRRVGSGAMSADVVLGSFPALVHFAERRLRRVFEAGILSPPPRDLEGEAALAAAVLGAGR